MLKIFIVGIGGFLGAIARYVLSAWIGQNWGRSFPLGTFVVNISGCFFIGLVMVLFTERFMANPQWRMFLAVGFLGAFTTFSTFEYEISGLLRDGEWLIAAMNAVFSVAAGFAALKIGEVIAKAI